MKEKNSQQEKQFNLKRFAAIGLLGISALFMLTSCQPKQAEAKQPDFVIIDKNHSFPWQAENGTTFVFQVENDSRIELYPKNIERIIGPLCQEKLPDKQIEVIFTDDDSDCPPDPENNIKYTFGCSLIPRILLKTKISAEDFSAFDPETDWHEHIEIYNNTIDKVHQENPNSIIMYTPDFEKNPEDKPILTGRLSVNNSTMIHEFTHMCFTTEDEITPGEKQREYFKLMLKNLSGNLLFRELDQ